jgi:hypothetical protein
VREPFLFTHSLFFSVIILGVLYEEDDLAGYHVSLSFCFSFRPSGSEYLFVEFFVKPCERALQAVVNQACVSLISVQ